MAVAPAISSFSRASGPAGTVVTVNGTGFAGSGTACTGTTVTFHGVKASACTFVSAASLKATVPLPASTGPITVKTAGGSATSATNANGYFTGITLKVPASALPGTHWVSGEGRHSGLFAQRAFTVATPWDQFGRVARHTHANPFENVLAPGNVSGLDEAWRYYTGMGFERSSPAVVNGVVYIGSGSGSQAGSVYALDAATGAKLWSYPTESFVSYESSPAVTNGVLYTSSSGTNDRNVYAFDLATGLQAPSRPARSALHPNYSLRIQR